MSLDVGMGVFGWVGVWWSVWVCVCWGVLNGSMIYFIQASNYYKHYRMTRVGLINILAYIYNDKIK